MNMFVYDIDKNILFQYNAEGGILPRQDESIVYNDIVYKVKDIKHVIERDLDNGNYLINVDITVEACCNTHAVKDNEILTCDGHLNLDEAYREISVLHWAYCSEEDANLTEDGKALKKELNKFIDKIKQF